MDPSAGMDKLEKIRGMPHGFPFAMVVLGVAFCCLSMTLGGINEWFFRALQGSSLSLGVHLIIVGGVLQGALWIADAIRRPADKA